MKKILVVTDVTGYMRGGVPAVTRQLISGMASRGYNVGLFGDIPVTDDESAQHFPMSFPAGNAFQSELGRALAAFRPDLVHVMSMNSRGVVAMLPLLVGTPWLLTCHSIPPSERKFPGLHGNETLHYLARNSRYLPHTLAWMWLFNRRVIPKLVVHSAAVASSAKTYGYPSHQTSIIHLGGDWAAAGDHHPRPAFGSGPKLMTTGGIAHTKGFHDAITALASVRNHFPDFEYQIIGEVRDDSYIAYLNSLLSRYRIEKQVTIRSAVSNEEKNLALDNADLYIQPSHEEGFCLSYMEAALRVPRLVGTDSGAIRRISEADAGAAVVPVKSPARLADAIIGLLSRHLPADCMEQRRARLTADFNWASYLDAHEEIYGQLLSPSAAPRQPTG